MSVSAPASFSEDGGSGVFTFSRGVVADPAQMAFFDETGAILPFEVDTWNEDGESLVWVLVPSLAQGATVSLATGNPGYASPDLAPALWRLAGYVAVLHLGGDGPALAGSTVQDVGATAYGPTGAEAGSELAVAAGAVGAARLVDGSAAGASTKARIAVDNFDAYPADYSRLTVSFWANHAADPRASERLFGNRDVLESEATGFHAILQNVSTAARPVVRVVGTPTLNSAANLDQQVDATPASDVEWIGAWTLFSYSVQPTPDLTYFHVAGKRVSHSGHRQGGTTGSTTFASLMPRGAGVPFAFGNSVDTVKSGYQSFKGSMDEIRVRNGAVTDDWAFAEYATVKDPEFLACRTRTPPSMIFLW